MIAKAEEDKNESGLSVLEIRTARTSEETPEAMKQFLANLTNLKKTVVPHLWFYFIPFTLEIAIIDQLIYFYITIQKEYEAYVEAQLVSQYPRALVTKVKDYLPGIFEKKETLSVGQIKLSHSYLYPLKTYTSFKEIDPLSSLLGVLSKMTPEDRISIQMLLYPAGTYWQRAGERPPPDIRTVQVSW